MILIVTPDRNTPGKADFTGAFRPEASAFVRKLTAQGVPTERVQVDLSKSAQRRRLQVLEAIDGIGAEVACVAFFCHGLSRGLAQLGWTTTTSGPLVDMLTSVAADDRMGVVLYACSTGNSAGPGGDGGFADWLRDELAERLGEVRVDAHTNAGHTTKNPYVRRFESGPQAFVGGGQWLIEPSSPLWKKWRAALRTDFRFEFPFLTKEEIVQRLSTGA